jgi:hypothetical protein
MPMAESGETRMGGVLPAGQEYLEKCKHLFEEDKVFQAWRAEQALAKIDPELHARHSAFLDLVRQAGEEAAGACETLQSDDSWTVVRKGSYAGDCKVWYRPEEGTAIHSLRMSADMQVFSRTSW